MPAAPLPPNEAERLLELRSLSILDTLPEGTYDAITLLASQICDVPIALISLVDEERQWFKSRIGLEAGETHRDLAFCAHAINEPDSLMIVPDASIDDRFSQNPLVTGDPSIRFYAGAPLIGPGGSALGTLCVIDRTPRTLTSDQKKALEALSLQVTALLELRKTVGELERNQQELRAATRQRDAFMATISHEIRTPLTAVIGYVELLQEEMSDDDRTDILARVAHQASDVAHLIEDLLVAARAEAGGLSVTSEPVDLEVQVARAIEGLDPDAEFNVIDADGSAMAIADPDRVRQIIRNLLTNAVRYGGPNITVNVRQVGDVSHLTVCDDGEGIPESDRERIFQPFGRAEDARPVASSVGLGLSISRLLAEKMGGTLTYRMARGRSVFDLALPAALEPALA